MILQVTSPGDFPVNGPAYDGGSVYAVRVVQFSAGATIAFDSQKSTRKILGYFAYRNAREPGWQKIWLTGSCIIELATSPEESFGGSGVAGVAAIDANQNSVVVGPDAPGIAPTANPVNVGGIDVAGLVRRLLMDGSGRLQGLGSSRKASFTASMRNAFVVGNTGGDIAALSHLAAATKRVELCGLDIIIPSQAAAAGLSTFNLRRWTGHTALTGNSVAAALAADFADGAPETTLSAESVPGTPIGFTGGTLRDSVELTRVTLNAVLTQYSWRLLPHEKPFTLRALTAEALALNAVFAGAMTGNFEIEAVWHFTEE